MIVIAFIGHDKEKIKKENIKNVLVNNKNEMYEYLVNNIESIDFYYLVVKDNKISLKKYGKKGERNITIDQVDDFLKYGMHIDILKPLIIEIDEDSDNKVYKEDDKFLYAKAIKINLDVIVAITIKYEKKIEENYFFVKEGEKFRIYIYIDEEYIKGVLVDHPFIFEKCNYSDYVI